MQTNTEWKLVPEPAKRRKTDLLHLRHGTGDISVELHKQLRMRLSFFIDQISPWQYKVKVELYAKPLEISIFITKHKFETRTIDYTYKLRHTYLGVS